MAADGVAKLKAELAAIEIWDRDYYRAQRHDDIDEVSYRHRQERREEILAEILHIVCVDLMFPTLIAVKRC